MAVKFAYYVVNIEGLSASDRAEVCALAVRTLEDTAVRFEADIPWAEATDWSADVRKASGTC